MARQWTPQQEAIFAWFKGSAEKALLARARAGTGKTSSILEALNYAPEARSGSVLLCAFNKRIQEELEAKAPRGVEVKTLHSLGFSAVRNHWDRCRPDEKRGQAIATEVCGRFAPRVVIGTVARLASFGKLTLTTEKAGLERLADAFDCLPSEALEEDGWTTERYVALAQACMEQAAKQSDTIDFDDMLWVPSRRKLRPSQFDLVVVDECFPGDHPVLLADGTMMSIQDIVRGRLPVNVLSYDEATGKQVSKCVTGWHEKPLQKKTIRIVAQRVMYANDGRRLNTTTARTKAGRRYIVCTEDHRIFANGTWVEAKHLRPGDKLQLESGTPRAPAISHKYKHTIAGKAVLRAGLVERQHTLPKYRGGSISLRGGNGKGPTYAQRVLKEALGHDWQTEFVVPVGRGRRSGWPTHYKIDIAHHGCRIAIEVDGETHRTPERRAQDAKKDRFLTENGWTVHRFWNYEAVQRAEEIAASMPRNCPVEAEVISVDDYPIKDLSVFDITVEDTHCYYVNGLLVHNCQDMNAAQLALARSALRPGGRIVVVGDDRQALYKFQGADAQAIDRMKAELSASELPLTITFRCPRRVVQVAQHFVPDYRSADGAPAGRAQWSDMGALVRGAVPGDFVLSRSNAGAVEACLALLRRGTRAQVLGRDIGAGLLKVTDQLDAGGGLVAFLARVHAWAENEAAKAKALDKPQRAERVADQEETLAVLAEGLTTVAELRDRVRDLFTDAAGAGRVTCSTVHKAKGLEADTAWVLTHTFRQARTPEEDNIRYVAATRARATLNLVEKDGKPVDEGFEGAMRRVEI